MKAVDYNSGVYYSEARINPTWKLHAPKHFDDVYLQTMDIRVGPGNSDIDSWKICFNMRHRWTPIVCTGSNLTLEASHVPSPFGVSWVGPNGFTSTLPDPQLQNVGLLMAGDYYATITPSNGCSFTDTVHLEVVDSVVATITTPSDTTIHAGDTLNLIGSTSLFPSLPGSVQPLGAWSSDSTALIGDTLIVAPMVTTTYYYAAINVAGGCATTDSVTITVLPTAVDPEALYGSALAQAAIHPNPTHDLLHIVGLPMDLHVEYMVTDVLGHPLIVGKAMDIDVRSLPAGTYLLRLQARNELRTLRFVKQ